jgi:RNase P subunit RPR2
MESIVENNVGMAIIERNIYELTIVRIFCPNCETYVTQFEVLPNDKRTITMNCPNCQTSVCFRNDTDDYSN